MDYGDASGFVQANWLTPVKIRTIALTGSEGYLEGNYITQELELYKHNMKKTENKGFSNFVISMGEPEKEIIKVDFEEPLAVELKAFMSKINGDKDPIERSRPMLGMPFVLSLEAIQPYEKGGA